MDGSGKSTKARFLAADLEARGREVVCLREPGGTALAERIRALVREIGEDPPNARAETLLFLASRAQLVENVVRCVADYDLSVLSGKSGTERTAVPFRLVDGNGEEVDSNLIDVTAQSVSLDSIVVSQTLYSEKALVINTSDLTVGNPADGYTIRRVSSEPATLLVAGTDSFISSLHELHLAEFTDQQIDITDLTTSVTRNISLNKTTDIAHYSSDTVMITVEIAPR